MCTMESEQFFLKWNNFENNLTSGFADLLQQEAMVDVTLAAEGKIIQAHKIILSICSSYFRNMFQVNPCQHPIVVLKDVGYQELTDMLDFMYKGEANVRQQDLPSFLKLAETLKVKGLAGNQAETDENLRKRSSHSQLSTLTKDSLPNEKDPPSNDFSNKDSMLRKKQKRSISPIISSESKILPHSENIKLEIEEYENNFMGNNVMNAGQNVIMKEERLSDNSLDSYDNHPMHETVGVEKEAGPSTLEENFETIPQEYIKTGEYSFTETCYGGYLLVLGGYSFRKKSTRAKRSYWFCCKPKCLAKGILHPDGKFQLTNCLHNHEPNHEDIKKKEQLIQLKKLAVKLNAPGHNLLDALGIKDDIEKHLNFIRTCRSRTRKQNGNEATDLNFPIQVGLNYKRLASSISSRGIIFHLGYLYRQDSINPNNENCKYWRCTVKDCKARAKTDEMGNLTILNSNHSHCPNETEETSKQSRHRSSSEASKSNKTADDIEEHGLKSFNLENSIRKVRKCFRKQTTPADESDKSETVTTVYCSSATDTETFNIEKLVADTLEENYGVTSQFHCT